MRDSNNPAPAVRRQQPTLPTETEPEQQQSAASGPGAAGAPHLSVAAEDIDMQGFDDCEALIIEMLEQGADAAVERGIREPNIDKKVEEAVRAMVLRNAALAIRLGQHRRQPPAVGGEL